MLEGATVHTSLTICERWRLRAEEYRAVAGTMRDPACRQSMEGLATTFEQMAAREEVRLRAISPALCEAFAEECETFSLRLTTDGGRAAVLKIADRWRREAQKIRTPSAA
jgi:hypothetical protein